MSITDFVLWHGTADARCFCRTYGNFIFRDGYFVKILQMNWGRDSVVGIATCCRLGGPGFEPRWGEIFRTHPDKPRCPHNLVCTGYRVFFSGGKMIGACRQPPIPFSVGFLRPFCASLACNGRAFFRCSKWTTFVQQKTSHLHWPPALYENSHYWTLISRFNTVDKSVSRQTRLGLVSSYFHRLRSKISGCCVSAFCSFTPQRRYCANRVETRLRTGRPVHRGLIVLGSRKFSVLDGVQSASGCQSAIGTVGTGASF
jgi:hypothetical protein